MSQALSEPASASQRLAKLHDVAGLLASLAGERERVAAAIIDVDEAHEMSSTLARARFDDLAARAAMLAAAGVEALLASGLSSPTAIAFLADAIEVEITHLEAVLPSLPSSRRMPGSQGIADAVIKPR